MSKSLKIFAVIIGLFPFTSCLAAEMSEFSVMGDLRWRYEYRNNADFLETSNDASNFHLGRARIGVQAQAMSNTWGLIQFQDSRYWGEELNAAGQYPFTTYDGSARTFDVHQAFMQIDHLWGSDFSVKLGRQELSYGDERLIGADEWNNIGQSFDGGKVMFTSQRFDFDVFYTAHVPFYPMFSTLNPFVPPGAGGNNGNITFSGFYGSAKPIEELTWDGYLLLLYDGNTAPDKSWIWTIGTRATGVVAEQFDYNGEFAFQFGNFNTLDQSAFAMALKGGYTFPTSVEPRVGLSFAFASGDDGTDPTESHTFFSLFPSPHGKFGKMDYQDWSNMVNLGLHGSVKPASPFKLKGGLNFFWLEEDADFWYQPYGFVFDAPGAWGGAGDDSKSIGTEFDVGVHYDYNAAVGFDAGFSHFFGGERLEQEGAPDNSTWFYAGTKLTF